MRIPMITVVTLASATLLQSQQIQVTLVEERTRIPVPGLVSILALDGTITARALTNISGHVIIPVPPGRYVVAGARIGFTGARSDTLTVVEGATVTLRLTMPAEQVVLPEVVTEARRSECSAGDRRPELQTVWEEARKVLTTVVLTRDQLHPVLSVARIERTRGPLGNILSERVVSRRRGQGNPYHTLTTAELLDQGFSRTSGEDITFYAPDADLLLSEGFLDTHCFGLDTDRERIGLTFTPKPSRRQTGIAGTLWMLRTEGVLDEVEFEYVNAPYPYDRTRATGVVRFVQMSGLGWIVGEWAVRMPRVARVQQRIVGAQLDDREVVLGMVEEGGVVEPANAADRPPTVAARSRDGAAGGVVALPGGFPTAEALLSSYCGVEVAADSTRGILIGMIRTPDGGPVRGGRLRVSWGSDAAPRPGAGPGAEVEADAAGAFYACGIPLGSFLRLDNGGRPVGKPIGTRRDERVIVREFVVP